VAVDLSKIYEKSTSVNFVEFKVNIWNEYPTEAEADLSLTDVGGSTLYKFSSIFISRGDILFKQTDAIVINPGFSSQLVSFDAVNIDSIKAVNYLVFNVRIILKQANPYNFQYWDGIKLTCQVGAKVDFVLNNL